MSLCELPTTTSLVTSTHELLTRFYVPALRKSTRYDRGVGYFTSSWLRLAATGLIGLAANGGSARFLASPKLDPDDVAALSRGADALASDALYRALQRTLDELEHDLEHDTLDALAWMIADGLLEFRLALPTADLDGDFHDKFGVFRDAEGHAIAFNGSPNDSERAFRNYESISVFYSWIDEREAMRVSEQQQRFDVIWANEDVNLRVYPMPEAIRRGIIEYTSRSKRPYNVRALVSQSDRWAHQRQALAAFLKHRHGVLEMATGTGKTRTALSIISELLQRELVTGAIVVAYGTDLLDQWHRELLLHTSLPVFRAYGIYKDALSFLNDPDGAVLLTSRQNLADIATRLPAHAAKRIVLVCDEVHGMGSPALVASLDGLLGKFVYRLGLSATPEREYDEAGNHFIEAQIGSVFFRFGLAEAIQRGILCGFDYAELEYEFSDDDRAALRRAFRRYHAKVSGGVAPPPEKLYQEIARIRKLSINKIPQFRSYVSAYPSILRRCLIFVETAEYGLKVQDVLMDFHVDFHTYYGDDDRANLTRFANGELECLITCHRISEGIDIRSVNSIVLFASARARLETVQRLGRCLRSDPDNPQKRAKVVDFIRMDNVDENDPTGELNADIERRDWFRVLAALPKKP